MNLIKVMLSILAPSAISVDVVRAQEIASVAHRFVEREDMAEYIKREQRNTRRKEGDSEEMKVRVYDYSLPPPPAACPSARYLSVSRPLVQMHSSYFVISFLRL